MSRTASQPMTLAEFLHWEEGQEGRYEFDGVAAVGMTGGTSAHAFIQAGLLRALGVQLLGKSCRPCGAELQVRLANSIRYPDAFVICAPVAPSATFVTDPVVIFEIASKRTVNDDLGVKRLEYQATPSVQRYVVLQQSHRAGQMFYRNGDAWEAEFLVGDDAILEMPEIGVTISLAEIYQGVLLESDRR